MKRARSEAWRVSVDAVRGVLQRPAQGQVLELPGREGRAVARALGRLQGPQSTAQLRRALQHVADPDAALAALTQHGVLRPWHPSATARVGGAVPTRLQSLLGHGGWRLPPLWVTVPGSRKRAPRSARCTLFALSTGVYAVHAHARPCALCVALRRVAHLPGTRPFRFVPNDAPGWQWAELLLAVQSAPPRADEVVAIEGPASGLIRARAMAHPDCPLCYRALPRGRQAMLAALRIQIRPGRDLQATPIGAAATAQLLHPQLGALSLDEEARHPALLPLRTPFVWGSVQLARWKDARVWPASTLGGIYSADREPAWRWRLAVSEGVERLAVRGAVWQERRTARGHREVVAPSQLYSRAGAQEDAARRPVVRGLDLLTGREAWVPYESVAVGLPRRFFPGACRDETFYTGTASHQTLTQAAVHATVELLKRDAFMIAWYRQRALPRLRWPLRSSPEVQQRRAFLEGLGFRLELFDLTWSLGLPMVLLRTSATRAQGNWVRGGSLLVPAGGFEGLQALEHALRLTCSQYVSFGRERRPERDPRRPQAVRAFARRVGFWPLIARYLDPRHAHAHAFLGAGERSFEALPRVTARSPQAQREALREHLAPHFPRWVLVRLTDEVAQRAGLEVAKVILPGAALISSARTTQDLSLPRMRGPWSDATAEVPVRHPHPAY